VSKSAYSVVLFYSTSGALRAEKLLKGDAVSIKLIPVPRQLSSDCGVCVRFERPDEDLVRQRLVEGKVEIQGIYEI
jgi:hypothetical protein